MSARKAKVPETQLQETQVQEAEVQETGGHEAPVFVLVVDQGPVQRTLREHRAASTAAKRSAGRALGEEHGYVDRNQRIGNDRIARHRADRLDLRTLARAFRAARTAGTD